MSTTERNRILLVEDEEHLAFTLSFNLGEEGYQVDVAESLQVARSTLTEDHDLIVLDVMLPDGSGFDYASELRSADNLVPILMLTAKGTPEDIVTGLEVGADDYLTKPFELAELIGRISAILRRRYWENSQRMDRPELPTIVNYQFAGNEVDFSTQEVLAQGQSVRLTTLELRLLQFFVARENQVVSREQLLEAVWEMPRVTNTRTVDNFLVRLRRVFERNPGEPRHFQTVRGVGYRFVPEPEKC